MKAKILFSVLVVAFMAITFNSCKKEDDVVDFKILSINPVENTACVLHQVFVIEFSTKIQFEASKFTYQELNPTPNFSKNVVYDGDKKVTITFTGNSYVSNNEFYIGVEKLKSADGRTLPDKWFHYTMKR